MATTPEGRVKDAVKALLHTHGILPASKAGAFPETTQGWYFMPVPTGHGVAGIHDFVGHHKGRFFTVEAKAPGRRGEKFHGLSPAQELQRLSIEISGAKVFVVDGDLSELEAWLNRSDQKCRLCGKQMLPYNGQFNHPNSDTGGDCLECVQKIENGGL